MLTLEIYSSYVKFLEGRQKQVENEIAQTMTRIKWTKNISRFFFFASEWMEKVKFILL